MTEDRRHSLIGELFEDALRLPPADRRTFLRQACGDDEELLREVEELLAKADDPSGPIPPEAEHGEAERGSESASDLLLERLEGQKPGQSRYRLLGELARGGMGAILRVWDAALRRHLAMKIVLGSDGNPAETSSVEPRRLARFLEEAQITGQLDHPGIVPVHELGIDDGGRVFFTMRLVKGWDLDEILRFVREERGGWTRTRALNVLLKVCEAMAYAHDHHVVHRDLKPSNIKVGRYGDVYVMDWGLGRMMDREDVVDVRPEGEPPQRSEIHTFREERAPDPDSPLLTRDGDVLGTPAYMSPEQARGEQAAMGPPSDVYALGAILYELLTGHEPYHVSGPRLSAYAVWRWVLEGPPRPVEELAPDSPPELVAICEKAMARDVDRRFANMGQLAGQLRAFLEGRVVSVHRVGPVIELKKWVRRNPFAAGALGTAILAVVFGVLALWWGARRMALRNQLEADVYTAGRLLDEAPMLWPAEADRAGRFARWERECEALLARRAQERAGAAARPPSAEDAYLLESLRVRRDALLELERKGLADPGQVPGGGDVEDYVAVVAWEVARIEDRLERTPEPPRRAEQAGIEALGAVLALELEALATRELPRVRARFRGTTSTVEEARWGEAVRSVAADARYGGLVLEPQEGLVPIGVDPGSKLWEFWLPASGAAPVRDGDGRLRMRPETGLVLVLVPGGTVRMGVELRDATSTDYLSPADLPEDLPARPAEGHAFEPPRRIPVTPFLLSKFELTQAQWLRLTDELPSAFPPGNRPGTSPVVTPTHPVESVTWSECDEALARWGLELPTEAQWVRAAGGVESVRWSVPTFPPYATRIHVPVDALPPAPLGFHGLRGNVREWCRDWWSPGYSSSQVVRVLPRSGEIVPRISNRRALRGGSFRSDPLDAFVFLRVGSRPASAQIDFGVRPARSIR